nr:hypothetical protein [Vibrio vulnificus]
MRKSILALSAIAAVSAVPAQAEYLFGFGSMYADYQVSDHRLQRMTHELVHLMVKEGIEVTPRHPAATPP